MVERGYVYTVIFKYCKYLPGFKIRKKSPWSISDKKRTNHLLNLNKRSVRKILVTSSSDECPKAYAEHICLEKEEEEEEIIEPYLCDCAVLHLLRLKN